MSGGGKGDSKTQTIQLPPEIAAAAQRNLAAAESAANIGYVPYQGPTVAALNPMSVDAMASRADMTKAFGMGAGGEALRASIPTPKTYAGGVQGYDPMALYLEALSKIDPAQRAAIDSFTRPGARPTGPTAAPSSGNNSGRREAEYYQERRGGNTAADRIAAGGGRPSSKSGGYTGFRDMVNGGGPGASRKKR